MHAMYSRKKTDWSKGHWGVGGERSCAINWMVRAGLLLEGISEKKKKKIGVSQIVIRTQLDQSP